MSSPSQPPPSSNGGKQSLSGMLPPRAAGLPATTSPAQMPTLAVGVNVPPNAETAFLQQMTPEHIHVAFDVQLEHLRLESQLQSQRLEQRDGELKRRHEVKMKRLELRENREGGTRSLIYWFGTIFSIILFSMLTFLLYKGEYTIAIGLVSHLAALVAGYFAGRHESRKKQQGEAEEPD